VRGSARLSCSRVAPSAALRRGGKAVEPNVPDISRDAGSGKSEGLRKSAPKTVEDELHRKPGQKYA
jgi:hypothetical protein